MEFLNRSGLCQHLQGHPEHVQNAMWHLDALRTFCGIFLHQDTGAIQKCSSHFGTRRFCLLNSLAVFFPPCKKVLDLNKILSLSSHAWMRKFLLFICFTKLSVELHLLFLCPYCYGPVKCTAIRTCNAQDAGFMKPTSPNQRPRPAGNTKHRARQH